MRSISGSPRHHGHISNYAIIAFAIVLVAGTTLTVLAVARSRVPDEESIRRCIEKQLQRSEYTHQLRVSGFESVGNKRYTGIIEFSDGQRGRITAKAVGDRLEFA